jgi:selenoprotein W-related protein
LGDRPRDISELTLIPSGGGVFEVMVDGDLVFSKKAEKRHPEYREIQEALRGR